MSNRKKLFGILYVMSLAGFSFVFVGNGCSQSFSTQATNTSDMSSELDVNETPVDYVPGAKQVSVAYSKKMLDHMLNCAGVPLASDATLRMFDTKKGAISQSGSAETMTSPMYMAIISIGGEVCKDLIDQEKAAGASARIFRNWNFGSNNLPASSDINVAINRLANSCWQRAETAQEQADIQEATYSIVAAEPDAANKAAIMLCTSMISSLSAIMD